MKNFNKRQDIEKKIAKLKRQLSSSESPIGDWKGIKQREYADAGKPKPYTDEVMKIYYEKRFAVRAQINELQKELEELPETEE